MYCVCVWVCVSRVFEKYSLLIELNLLVMLFNLLNHHLEIMALKLYIYHENPIKLLLLFTLYTVGENDMDASKKLNNFDAPN